MSSGVFDTEKDTPTPKHDKIVMWFEDTMADRLGRGWTTKKIEWEAPIRQHVYQGPSLPRGERVIGYADLLVTLEKENGLVHYLIVEAKSEIASLGACIRQLKGYQAAFCTYHGLDHSQVIMGLVAPDVGPFVDRLYSQRISTWTVPAEVMG